MSEGALTIWRSITSSVVGRFCVTLVRLIPRGLVLALLVLMVLAGPSESLLLIAYGVAYPNIAIVVVCALYVMYASGARLKLPVLYLRRFRRVEASAFMALNIEKGLSRRFRIVTLDDDMFSPLEVPRWERFLSRVGALAIASVLTVGLLFISLFSLQRIAPVVPHMTFGDYLRGLAAIVPVPSSIFASCQLVALTIVLLVHRRRVRQRATQTLRSPEELSVVLRHIRQISGIFRAPAIMAPQATVVRTAGDFWQPAVCALVAHAAAVVVDVSDPSPNLLWELKLLAVTDSRNVVFIGQAAAVAAWRTATDELSMQMQERLHSHNIVLYSAGTAWWQWWNRSRFRRGLSAELRRVAQPDRVLRLRERPDLRLNFATWASRVWARTIVYGGIIVSVGVLLPWLILILASVPVADGGLR